MAEASNANTKARTRGETRKRTELQVGSPSYEDALSEPSNTAIPTTIAASICANTAPRVQTSSIPEPTTPITDQLPPQPQNEQISPLIRATATHMQMTTALMDRVEHLNEVTTQLSAKISPSICEFKIDSKEITSHIPFCSGDNPRQLIDFIEEVQSVVDLQLALDPILLRSLLNKVQGDLRTWWAAAVLRFESWNALKKSLLNDFISPVIKNQLINQLIRRSQKPDEPFKNFIKDILTKKKALDVDITNKELVLQIWSNVNYRTLLNLKDSPMPESIEDLQKIARRLEDFESRLKEAKLREEVSSQSKSEPDRTSTNTINKNSKNLKA